MSLNPIEKILDCIVEELKKEFPEERIKAAIDRACDRMEDYFRDGSIMDKFVEAIIASAIRKPFGIEETYPPAAPTPDVVADHEAALNTPAPPTTPPTITPTTPPVTSPLPMPVADDQEVEKAVAPEPTD